jgi:P-type Mg2+ transporter
LPSTSESASGLTSAEAAARLRAFGPNEPRVERASIWKTILPLIADPLILVLFLASVVSAAVGNLADAAIIDAMLLLSIALNFGQTYRSQRAAERLREQVGATALVLRDGTWTTIARAEVVPDDVIRLAAGDLVPADATLLRSRDLHVYEAALTGESLPAEKEADRPGANEIRMGTSVVSGTAEALVTRTGARTEFGDIVARLSAKRPETEFERGTRQFGYFITQTIFALVVFVMLTSILLHRDALQSLLFALALAVGLAPEFLPMIRAVTLARGAVRMSRKSVIVKHLPAIQNFGSIDILCCDKTGTLTAGVMTLSGRSDDETLRLAAINSALQTGIRSPFDEAILAAAPQAALPEKIDEMPFDFERRIVSVVIDDGAQRVLIAKGAPESILQRCRRAQPIGAPDSARVLAVARRVVPARHRYDRDDERDLELAGWLAFSDPPLPKAAEAMAALRDDGVAVKILTGDTEAVARSVCRSVGIACDAVLLGGDVERMTDGALGAAAEQTAVFARLTPAQKTRIVLALKSRGHVVGFLGDGINDAPSLRAADVGISVANAVGVAKEAAEIILLDGGLDVLHRGIREGRAAFGNVMKYVLMETSSNFGNMFSMAAASAFLPFLPMLPTQILLNNFLYDFSQITIPGDRVDATFMRKPQRWDVAMIRRFMFFVGPISSLFDFATFWLLLHVMRASATLFQTGWFVESLVTQTLVLFVIRTAANPLRSRPSPALFFTGMAIVVVALALPFSPIAPDIGLSALPVRYYVFLALLTTAYLCIVEAVKRRVMRHEPATP